MKYRSLGKTGMQVSEIGFGTWGIGGATSDGPNSYSQTNDRTSIAALLRALDVGMNFFDTSNIYGYGHAEELLGKAFAKKRDKVVIASKVGFVKHGGPWQLDPRYVRQELEKTLRRLNADYLDLYQVHSPPIGMLQEHPEYVETFRELKKEGKIRAYGYSVKNPNDAFIAVNDFGFETIQVNFNMIDQRAVENGLLDLARDKQVGVIARTPFCFGFLTDTITDFNFPADDHRSTWPRAQLERWANAPKLFAPLRSGKHWSPAELALKFCLSFPGVSSVIPGVLTPEQAVENSAASDGSYLSESQVREAIRIYQANVFFDPGLKAKNK